jgi:hypothetical protein
VHSSNERLTALDIATGNILWTGKPMGKYQSLVRDEKTMLVLNNEGELLVVKIGPGSIVDFGSAKIGQ